MTKRYYVVEGKSPRAKKRWSPIRHLLDTVEHEAVEAAKDRAKWEGWRTRVICFASPLDRHDDARVSVVWESPSTKGEA